MKINKYLYLRILQTYTGSLYGWEDVSTYDMNEYKLARQDLKTYRIEEPNLPHKLIERRIPNPAYNIETSQ